MNDLLAVYGLKFHPFRPDVPIEALLPTPEVDSFCRRVELSLANGGFAMSPATPGPVRAWRCGCSPKLRQRKSDEGRAILERVLDLIVVPI